jgi:hypothetical protein
MATPISTDANATGTSTVTIDIHTAVVDGWTEEVAESLAGFGESFPQIDQVMNFNPLGFGVGDTLYPIIVSELHDTFYVGETLSVDWTPATLAPAGFAVGESITYAQVSYLHDTFKVGDSFPQIDQITQLTDGFKVSEVITFERTASLTDIVAFGDEQILSTILEMESAFAMGGDIEATIVNSTVELSSTYYVSDSLFIGLEEILSDTALFTDSIVESVTANAILSDSFGVGEVLYLSATVLENLQSVYALGESLSFEGSVYNIELEGTAIWSDYLWAKDFEALAWTMNTQSGSIAPFDNYGFNTIVGHEGKVFAASPEGIFEITSDKDAGRNINAEVEWGFQDFGDKQRKRASDLYIGYTGGELEAKLETYGDSQIVYNYSMEKRDAEAPRNNRFKVGRGFKSRWWKLTLTNQVGADFQVRDVALNLIPTRRRL